MSSLFDCLFHTRYNSHVLRVFHTQFIISYKIMAIVYKPMKCYNCDPVQKYIEFLIYLVSRIISGRDQFYIYNNGYNKSTHLVILSFSLKPFILTTFDGPNVFFSNSLSSENTLVFKLDKNFWLTSQNILRWLFEFLFTLTLSGRTLSR